MLALPLLDPELLLELATAEELLLDPLEGGSDDDVDTRLLLQDKEPDDDPLAPDELEQPSQQQQPA